MKSKKIIALSALILFCLLLMFGCGSGKSTAEWNQAGSGSVADESAAAVTDVAEADFLYPEAAYAAPQAGVEQKIIKNANLRLRVKEAHSTSKEVEREVEILGGYLTNTNQSKIKGDKLRIYMTLRVPAENFEKVISYLEDLGTLEEKTIYTEDVTQEYIDLSAKVENLTIQEKRLQELLSQATKVEDLLKIEQEIARVRSEIDSYTGQLRYLTNKIDYSTIELTLLETAIEQEGLNIRNIDGTWSSSKAAFIGSINRLLQLTSTFVVAIFALLPFLALPGLIIVVLLVIRYKINQKERKI